jgi:hypothetical protein
MSVCVSCGEEVTIYRPADEIQVAIVGRFPFNVWLHRDCIDWTESFADTLEREPIGEEA